MIAELDQIDLKLFDQARTRILELQGQELDEVSAEILAIVEELDGRGPSQISFIDWDGESLLSSYGRLASLRVNLAQIAAVAQSRSNYTMRWKVYKNAKEWNPVKTAIEAEYARLGLKVVKADVENTLIDALWETTQTEVFLQEIADRAKTLYDATDRMLSAAKMRIQSLEDERRKTNMVDRTN